MVALLHEGNIDRKRACSTCVRRGVLITTMPRATPTLTKAPLDTEEKDVREVLRKLVRHLRGLAKAQGAFDQSNGDESDAAMNDGHVVGLDQAADIAEAWAARPEIRR
jgi:hypothetical protein